MNRIDDALAEYRAVYEAEPDNAVALQALERLYRQTEKWKDLLEVYEKRRELAYAADERKPVLYEIAKLYEEQIGDPAKATETYRAVLEDDAVDAVSLAALDALYQKTKEWEPYAEILRRRIELDVSEADLIDLKYRLAQAEEHHLSRSQVARSRTTVRSSSSTPTTRAPGSRSRACSKTRSSAAKRRASSRTSMRFVRIGSA